MNKNTTLETLTSLNRKRVLVEDLCAPSESLEWQLSRLHFAKHGSRSFTDSNLRVPFQATSDGALSEKTAQAIFQWIRASEGQMGASKQVTIVELGAGAGLFAKLFLDAFSDLCSHEQTDYYARLRYILSDQALRMLDDVRESGLFSRHADVVTKLELDVMRLDRGLIAFLEGQGVDRSSFICFIGNYLLDSLPFDIFRHRNGVLQRLLLRTYLTELRDRPDLISVHDRAREMGPKAIHDSLDKYVELYPYLFTEAVYCDCPDTYGPDSTRLLEYCRSVPEDVVFNWGARDLVKLLSNELGQHWMLLVNDYAWKPDRPKLQWEPYQRFGGTVAVGVDFRLLRTVLGLDAGLQWIEPLSDHTMIASRMIGRGIPSEIVDHFRTFFDQPERDRGYRQMREAREYVKQGRIDLALEAYKRALKEMKYNWALVGEVATFIADSIGDSAAALSLAEDGLRINPSYSPLLWVITGNAKLKLRRPGAKEAFEHALSTDANCTPAHIGLARHSIQDGDLTTALLHLARAFISDPAGRLHEESSRLQSQVFERLKNRWQMERRNFSNRCTLRNGA